MPDKKYYGADAIVDSLVNHDVKYVFGIPGAKIDRVFERLEHPVNPKSPRLIVTRHEHRMPRLSRRNRSDYWETWCSDDNIWPRCQQFSHGARNGNC